MYENVDVKIYPLNKLTRWLMEEPMILIIYLVIFLVFFLRHVP